jgi:CubicO group peptidase (beta-lactamase class C family)
MRIPLAIRVTGLLLPAWFGLARAGSNAPPRSQSEFAVMGTAKIVCSAVFVSGRDLEEALQNSAGIFLSREDWELLRSRASGKSDARIDLDRSASELRVTLHGYTGRARFFGDQGCVIIPPGYDEVFFQPVKLQTKLPDAATQDWPMGDRLPAGPLPPGVDEAKVKEAVDAAFAGEGLTAAFVVLHQGRIIAERYGQGAHKDMQLESWSMGKSVTATLLGALMQQGHFGLHDPAPVPLWRKDPEDPRSRIRVSDLLRMSGGLRFTHPSQPEWEWGRSVADHFFIYMGAVDAFHFSITRPAEFPPNTEGRYRNCDPLTLGYIIRQTVEKQGENYLAWPQKAVFDRLGIRKQVLEPDLRELPLDRIRLRDRSQLGPAGFALPAGRRLERRAHPARGLREIRQHTGPRMEGAGLWGTVLGERRRTLARAEERLLHGRRRRPARHHRADPRPGRGPSRARPRLAGGNRGAQQRSGKAGRGRRASSREDDRRLELSRNH